MKAQTDQEFIDTCFTTLYRLIKNDPNKVDDNIINAFCQFIPDFPHKSFVLISNYYIKTLEEFIDDPYNMISLLIDYFDYFIVSDISIEFIKLLIYITLNDEELTNFLIDNGFLDSVIKSLSNKKINDETLSFIYQLLLILSYQYPQSKEIEIKDNIIASHLKKPIASKNILNFLLVSKAKIGPKTVNSLSAINLHRSLYVLLQFASSKNDHSSLVDGSDWLVNQTNPLLQLKIFLTLLADDDCREKLSRLPQTITYLLDLVKKDSNEYLKLTSTCVRRLLNPQSLDNFQKNHFFEKYWKMIKTHQSIWSPCIMSIDMLVRTGYISDLNGILSELTKIINSNDSSASQAIKIIANASKYPKCKQILRKYKKYFNKLKDTGNFNEECQMFQENIQ